MSTLFRVEKALNGFSIEVCVPLKKDKKEKSDYFCYPSSYNTILVKDAKELGSSITALIPLLDTEYKNDDEFEEAFKEATKSE